MCEPPSVLVGDSFVVTDEEKTNELVTRETEVCVVDKRISPSNAEKEHGGAVAVVFFPA